MNKVSRFLENLFMNILVIISIILLTILIIPIGIIYSVYCGLDLIVTKIYERRRKRNEIILEKR